MMLPDTRHIPSVAGTHADDISTVFSSLLRVLNHIACSLIRNRSAVPEGVIRKMIRYA